MGSYWPVGLWWSGDDEEVILTIVRHGGSHVGDGEACCWLLGHGTVTRHLRMIDTGPGLVMNYYKLDSHYHCIIQPYSLHSVPDTH